MEACSWQPAWAAYIIPRLTRVIWQRKSGHSPAVITFSLWSLSSPWLGSHEPVSASYWSASVLTALWLADDGLTPDLSSDVRRVGAGSEVVWKQTFVSGPHSAESFLTNENDETKCLHQWGNEGRPGLKYAHNKLRVPTQLTNVLSALSHTAWSNNLSFNLNFNMYVRQAATDSADESLNFKRWWFACSNSRQLSRHSPLVVIGIAIHKMNA